MCKTKTRFERQTNTRLQDSKKLEILIYGNFNADVGYNKILPLENELKYNEKNFNYNIKKFKLPL